jgi:hypothetical protein
VALSIGIVPCNPNANLIPTSDGNITKDLKIGNFPVGQWFHSNFRGKIGVQFCVGCAHPWERNGPIGINVILVNWTSIRKGREYLYRPV